MASSKTSKRFVAAITTIPALVSKPSISANNWLIVWSATPALAPAISIFPRLAATESNSSMKMIEGAVFLALLNKSLTLFAPTPTNISSKLEPEI